MFVSQGKAVLKADRMRRLFLDLVLNASQFSPEEASPASNLAILRGGGHAESGHTKISKRIPVETCSRTVALPARYHFGRGPDVRHVQWRPMTIGCLHFF